MPVLLSPLTLPALEIPNRLRMSPMCRYSADDGAAHGRPTDFHLAHYASHAFGGAGTVMVEATAVQERAGRPSAPGRSPSPDSRSPPQWGRRTSLR